ncbi:MAG: hypothetical protein ACLGH4_02015 [Actinomycetes bacterium]
MRQIRNQAAALAALALIASCSNDESTARTDPSPTGDGSATSATPEPDYTIVAETHLDGPGRWAMHAAGDPQAPLAVFDVPAGYQGRESYVWTHDDLDLDAYPGQLLYRAPTRVPADPCDVDRPSPRLGPTVEDLAEALAAQKRTTTTRPVPTELGGYRGLYLELSTTDGLNSEACAPQGGMLIFDAGGPGAERVLEVAATDRYWILDLGGRRVVVSAMTPAGARTESVERVTDVAEGITFVEASP